MVSMKKKELIFFLGIFLIQVKSVLDMTKIIELPDEITSIILLLGYLCLAFFIMIRDEGISIVEIILLCIGGISYIRSSFTGMFTLSVIIVAAKGIEINKILKFLLIFNIIVLSIHILLYGIYYFTDSNSLQLEVRSGTDVVRHDFLFGHPNTFSTYLIWTYLMYLYLKYDKINIKDYIVMIIIGALIYLLEN